MDVLILSEA